MAPGKRDLAVQLFGGSVGCTLGDKLRQACILGVRPAATGRSLRRLWGLRGGLRTAPSQAEFPGATDHGGMAALEPPARLKHPPADADYGDLPAPGCSVGYRP